MFNYSDGAIGKNGHYNYGVNGANDLNNVGIFLFTTNQNNRAYVNFGFRCVYRP